MTGPDGPRMGDPRRSDEAPGPRPGREAGGTTGACEPACGQGGAPRGRALEVLGVALRLGLTSFGGPIAHLGYFRDEYVVRRRWVDERRYADLVALCQFLPGPASSQVGIAVGVIRAGLLGGFAAWLGFTLPSALALALFAHGVRGIEGAGPGWLHGLKLVAVAVVAHAVWGMARALAPDRARGTLAVLAAGLMGLWPTPGVQVLALAGAGLVGWRAFAGSQPPPRVSDCPPVPRAFAVGCWVLLGALLVGLPVFRRLVPHPAVAVADSFVRAGALVFGGGHVVLPLLQAEVVPPGWVTPAEFVAGYGAAQAVPGPLFTFAAYLGAVMHVPPSGWPGAALALGAIFLPAFLLVLGALPIWEGVRAHPGVHGALGGVNAAVVGLLLAALYHPVWTSAVAGPADFALALGAFALLGLWRFPPWLVVLLTAAGAASLPARG